MGILALKSSREWAAPLSLLLESLSCLMSSLLPLPSELGRTDQLALWEGGKRGQGEGQVLGCKRMVPTLPLPLSGPLHSTPPPPDPLLHRGDDVTSPTGWPQWPRQERRRKKGPRGHRAGTGTLRRAAILPGVRGTSRHFCDKSPQLAAVVRVVTWHPGLRGHHLVL